MGVLLTGTSFRSYSPHARFCGRVFAGHDRDHVPHPPSCSSASTKEMIKAVVLGPAFLFWAANQLWPNLPEAALFNDIAIVLFVLDVFRVIVGWPDRPLIRPRCRDCQVCGAERRS